MSRLKAGEEQAFERLVRWLGPQLLVVASRFLRDEADAHDAIQDAFLSAFRSLDRFEGGCRLATWLHRIVVNASLMKLRSQRRKQEASIEDLLPKFSLDGHHADQVCEWRETSASEVEREETRALVRACIDRLPETYRNVVLLRDIEELDTAETAKALGVTENAVKIRLHRARQALRTLMNSHFQSEGA